MTLTVKTPPADEPVTLSEAKDHLRVDGSDHDSQVTAVITAARERAERYLGRALVTQTLELRLDAFPAAIDLPRPPVQSVASIKYIDSDGDEQTLDSADYKVDAEGARIIPTDDWPHTLDTVNAVTVEYTAGYGDPEDVPEAIKQGILVHAERMFDRHDMNYDRTLATIAASLLWPYRQMAV